MPEEERRRTASPLEVVKTVLSAFFGVRRRADHDSAELNPVHVIMAGIAAAAILVASLVLLVKFIVSRAG